MSGEMSVEEIKKSIKIYFTVFTALMILTIVTVGVSYLHLPVGTAIAVALFVASIKATLVALFFMHLNHEKKIIYASLALTAIFFVFLLATTIMI